MNFSISQPNSTLRSRLTNYLTNPIATTTVILDPSYTGQGGDVNTFTTWDDAYNAVKNVSGVRSIAFATQTTNAGSEDLFFAGAAGTYDMTNIFIEQTTPNTMNINITPGFTLNNLLGIFGYVMSFNVENLTQNFITIPDLPGRVSALFILQSVSITGTFAANTHFLYTAGNFGTLFIYLTGSIGSILIFSANTFRAENGVDITLDNGRANTFIVPTSISTDTGDLTITGFTSPTIPALAADYTNVGGAVAFGSNVVPTSQIRNADPTVDDDGTNGYQMGTIWVNTTANTVFILGDNADGAAVWTQIAP